MEGIKTCCLTSAITMSNERLTHAEKHLRSVVGKLIREGFTCFISGFTDEIDLIFARVVTEFKAKHDGLKLEAAIPYRNILKNDDSAFQELLLACDIITIHGEHHSQSCFMKRNHYMVNLSDKIITVYDGSKNGDAPYALEYAKLLRKEIERVKF